MIKDKGLPGANPTSKTTTNTAGGCHSSICPCPYINVTVLIDRIAGNYDRMIAILSDGGRRS